MLSVTLSSKGQLVIPKEVRKSVSLEEGDRLSVSVISGEIRLRRIEPASPVTLEQVAGCLGKLGRKSISEETLKTVIKERLKARLST